MSTAEYDQIQAQIQLVKREVASSGLPEELRKLREQIRPYPAWVVNFGWPMHPLVSDMETEDAKVTRFTFNGVKYELTFEREANYYETSSRGSTPLKGRLTVEAAGVLVLDARFYGESDEYSDHWRYHDSETYKNGLWVQDLLRFKNESNLLIEEARAQNILAQKRDPARLKEMREKFSIPETFKAPTAFSERKSPGKLFGEFLRALFKG